MFDNLTPDTILLVGAGPMAIDYAKVLSNMGVKFVVVGRGAASASAFEKTTGIRVEKGGLNAYNGRQGEYSAIVAVGVEELANVTVGLLESGVKNILLEKPGGIDSGAISRVASFARDVSASVNVAYNRRFYASVLKAKEIIRDDGGVASFNFEFTEWSHTVADLPKAPGIKENWLLANSSHVIDLAFFLGGKPREMSSFASGGLPWHPVASLFAGAGISESGALFSYQANWEAPGRWGVEVLTPKHRLIFRPLEKLFVQKIGSLEIAESDVDYQLDTQFKPGLYRQVDAWLAGSGNCGLPTIFDQEDMLRWYNQITHGLQPR